MYVVGFQARLRSAVQVVGRAARTLSHGWTSVQSCAVTPLFLITVATVDDRSQSIRMWSVQSQAADKAAELYQFTYAASHVSVNFVLLPSRAPASVTREGTGGNLGWASRPSSEEPPENDRGSRLDVDKAPQAPGVTRPDTITVPLPRRWQAIAFIPRPRDHRAS